MLTRVKQLGNDRNETGAAPTYCNASPPCTYNTRHLVSNRRGKRINDIEGSKLFIMRLQRRVGFLVTPNKKEVSLK